MEFTLQMKLKGNYPEVTEAFIKKALKRKKAEIGTRSSRKVSVLITDDKTKAKKHEDEPNAFTVLILASSISSSYDFDITAPDDFQENFIRFLTRVN
ncbi:MAG: hypothetical protein QG640_272 [Patescibacteria group bacterium]|nr:hypothetical protein [Patescibacteria group bacterium]